MPPSQKLGDGSGHHHADAEKVGDVALLVVQPQIHQQHAEQTAQQHDFGRGKTNIQIQ